MLRVVTDGEVDKTKIRATTLRISERQDYLLQILKQKTRVPTAERIREAVNLVLEKYKDEKKL